MTWADHFKGFCADFLIRLDHNLSLSHELQLEAAYCMVSVTLNRMAGLAPKRSYINH